MKKAKIAAILNGKEVVLNVGEREGVKGGDLFALRSPDKGIAAILCVFQVEEKMSLVRPLWVGYSLPQIWVGYRAYIMSVEEEDNETDIQVGRE